MVQDILNKNIVKYKLTYFDRSLLGQRENRCENKKKLEIYL